MVTQNNSIASIQLWQTFIREYNLNESQKQQFITYARLLIDYNQRFNLTAITEPAYIIADHFQDSLALHTFVDCMNLNMIADVGTGAGFPGIPLKILYPHLKLGLIEVMHKKVEFLNTVIKELGLADCCIFELDWRTFLRKTQEPIDLFVSRASLHPNELLRMFKPGCVYRDRQLVYWASKDWHIEPEEVSFFHREEAYMIGNKKRRLIFFARQLKGLP